ncbi:hypothetical protein FOA52_000161 [Chlamydomonas sp. UWO 241]|nr:hypothetical protein FOA52_000161 [Chlamydomonas sp. UWO 241]
MAHSRLLIFLVSGKFLAATALQATTATTIDKEFACSVRVEVKYTDWETAWATDHWSLASVNFYVSAPIGSAGRHPSWTFKATNPSWIGAQRDLGYWNVEVTSDSGDPNVTGTVLLDWQGLEPDGSEINLGCGCKVDVVYSEPWVENGKWLSALNCFVSTTGPSDVPHGWTFTLENLEYKESKGCWNTGPVTFSNGILTSTASNSWQALGAHAANTANVGCTISASKDGDGDAAAAVGPTKFSVNDVPCEIALTKL